ncbi:hypothetical protein AVEN_99814-1 [Araneus ventricosus]|uniref:Uncharacterized protein n=1 Tax=Araneus ventricosus TaxID=182803 RepID=A0A4Y2UUZ7_ARAVE|nr:hypothetical protein AVEN_99814-1 [Araneus ventricosus]
MLCKSTEYETVLDAVVKLPPFDLVGLLTGNFEIFQSVQSEYSDVLYYTKVRWLSAGCVFERVWQLKDDIVSFFHEKQCSAECEMFMNNLNVKMQGKN